MFSCVMMLKWVTRFCRLWNCLSTYSFTLRWTQPVLLCRMCWMLLTWRQLPANATHTGPTVPYT